jgi:hypothetical protein
MPTQRAQTAQRVQSGMLGKEAGGQEGGGQECDRRVSRRVGKRGSWALVTGVCCCSYWQRR